VTADDPTTTTAAPASPPLQPGFEDYTPGDALPAPPPAPTPENPTVSTVPGPYGPIYPEGYVDPNIPTPQAPQIVPVQPPSERGGTADVGG
jgi:hypothetical protein